MRVLFYFALLAGVTTLVTPGTAPQQPPVGIGIPTGMPTDGPEWEAYVQAQQAGVGTAEWFAPDGGAALPPLLPEDYMFADLGSDVVDEVAPRLPPGADVPRSEAVPLPLLPPDVEPTPWEEYRDVVGPSGWSGGASRPPPGKDEGGGTTEGADVPLGGNANEPTVAVNPLNPNNVAAANNGGYRVSTNRGVTWTALMLPPEPAGYFWDGDPSLAFDSLGRLFITYLGGIGGGIDVIVSRLNPTTGAVIAGPFKITTTGQNSGFGNDKDWLAADRFIGSPFQDRLYCSWTEFSAGTRVLTSYSTNQGATWSTPLQLGISTAEGFVWPVHDAVAPNGDVYVGYHAQPTFTNGCPNGISGRIWICRSTNGGVTFPQKNNAFTAGNADMTFNVQTAGTDGKIAGTQFWLQGSVQPWILPDPTTTGAVYVVANDDPDNNPNAGDPAKVYIARSADNGVTWGAPIRVDQGPAGTFQVMPTAAIDDDTGCLAVHWYDNRRGTKNGANRFLLDVMYTISHSKGVSWVAESQLNDATFDPDLGAPIRFNGPPPTTRIGEYDGVAMAQGDVYGVWTGNTANGQQMIYDTALGECDTDVKNNQLPDCQGPSGGFFSNLNSAVNPYIRVEEFVCPETGAINEVTFWGGGYDLSTGQGCSPATNIQSIQIDLFAFQTSTTCNWTKGNLLCSNRIPLAALQPTLECTNNAYNLQYTRFTAQLPQPCYQVKGTHYALQIAAVLSNPNNQCIFFWSPTGKIRGFPAISIDRTSGAVSCTPTADMAFVLANRPRGCSKDGQPVDCNAGGYFSNLNNNTNPYLRIDDFVCDGTGNIDQIAFWGGAWDASRGVPLDLASVCDKLQIDLFTWVAGGPCQWQTGQLLCSNQVNVADLRSSYECDGASNQRVFRYVATLPQKCYQQKGHHLVLRIAGISRDPNAPFLFYWQPTPTVKNAPAYSIDRTNGNCTAIGPDMAFEIFTFLKGDMNCDCVVDFGDIDPFVLALSDPSAYQQQYPNCNILNGDINNDGAVNFADIDPFVTCLSNGCP